MTDTVGWGYHFTGYEDAGLGFLDPAEFAALIAEFGEVPYRWYRDVGPCPNAHNDAVLGGGAQMGTTALACPICKGTTRIVREMEVPLAGRALGRLLLQQAQIGRTRAPIELEGGEIICTYIEDDYPLADGDRLVLSSRISDFSELRRRGEGADDRLRHSPVASILNVYLPPPTGELSGGFGVSDDATGVFWGTTGPPAGTQYTIRYRYYATFQVAAGSHHRRVRAKDGSSFPSRCVLQKFEQANFDTPGGQF
jgi:uncharacterized protein YbaR (Trm112 family)